MKLSFGRRRPFDSRRKDGGNCTVEAACLLLVFVLAVFSVYAFVHVVRAQKTVQLALDRTARELSAYSYPAAAVSDALRAALEQKNGETDDETVSMLLTASRGLLSVGRGSADAFSASDVAQTLFSDIRSGITAGSIGSVTDLFRNALRSYGDTPVQAVTAIAAGLGTYEAEGLLSHAAAIPLCEALVPTHIDAEAPDAFLRKCGVVNGLSGLDYSVSSVLPDGKNIRLCAVYEIQPGGTLVPIRLQVMQTAVTGSWCEAGEKNDDSVWKLANLARGKKIVAAEKRKTPAQAVRAGCGFDLYDASAGKVTSVISLNLFTAAYANAPAAGEAETAAAWTLLEKNVKKALHNGAQELKKSEKKLKEGAAVAMEDGNSLRFSGTGVKLCLRVVIPEEASVFSDALERLARLTESADGVFVEYVRKDRALG